MRASKGEHFIELHVAVAVDAGIGRAASFIRCYEFFYDFLAEFIGVIDDLKWDIQLERHIGGILYIFCRAAGVKTALAKILVLVQAHGCAHAAVTRLFHQVGRDRAVHAAAHSDQRAGCVFHGVSPP